MFDIYFPTSIGVTLRIPFRILILTLCSIIKQLDPTKAIGQKWSANQKNFDKKFRAEDSLIFLIRTKTLWWQPVTLRVIDFRSQRDIIHTRRTYGSNGVPDVFLNVLVVQHCKVADSEWIPEFGRVPQARVDYAFDRVASDIGRWKRQETYKK